MDLIQKLVPQVTDKDDVILLGAGSIEQFEKLREKAGSFCVLERKETEIHSLQKRGLKSFLVRSIDETLEFFISEIDELKLQNMFVIVNPTSSVVDLEFYQKIETLLTGRSSYSFDLHLTLLGQRKIQDSKKTHQLLHLNQGLKMIDRNQFSTSEKHLYSILDEISR